MCIMIIPRKSVHKRVMKSVDNTDTCKACVLFLVSFIAFDIFSSLFISLKMYNFTYERP